MVSLGFCRSRTARNTELMAVAAVARPFGGTNHQLGDHLRLKPCCRASRIGAANSARFFVKSSASIRASQPNTGFSSVSLMRSSTASETSHKDEVMTSAATVDGLVFSPTSRLAR